MRHITTGQVVALVIAGLLVWAGVWLLVDARDNRRHFYRYQNHRPLDIAVDLSKPGEFVAPFDQQYRCPHFQTLVLSIPEDARRVLAAMDRPPAPELTWELTDRTGKVETSDEVAGEFSWEKAPQYDGILLSMFGPPIRDNYTFKLTVTRAVPELAGVEQRIVSKHNSCTLSLMIPQLESLVGTALLIPAGIILLVVAVRLVRECRTPA